MSASKTKPSSLFVDHLTVIDFSYFDPKRFVVGESWIVDIELFGELNDEGMLFDFGHVKKQIKMAIDEGVDHKLLLPIQAPNLSIEENDDNVSVTYQGQGEQFEYQSPREAVYFVDAAEVTIENVTPMLQRYLKTLMPSNVTDIAITLRCENIEGSFYQYSHGLKKHLGDCQRIAHGHRSDLQIFFDGKRNIEMENQWCEHWRDIYLITTEDIVDEPNINGIAHYRCEYEAEQGFFSICLAKERCQLIETDSTVELIAQFIATSVRELQPAVNEIKVKAFEGYRKGAFAINQLDNL